MTDIASRPVSQGSPVTFRGAEIEGELAKRAEAGRLLGPIAKRDLSRYCKLLARELQTVRLTEPEALLPCDLTKDTRPIGWIPILWAEVDEDLRRTHVDQRRGSDGQALVEKLRRLTPGQTFAVVDLLERCSRVAAKDERVRLLRVEGVIE